MELNKNEIWIKNDNGDIVKSSAPIIISASRSTDIPAFYSKWLINRLEREYIKWINPFNRNNPMYISFEKARLFVFWSKNPKPLLKYLHEFDKRSINYYFQYTINDYENEGLEPNVASLTDRINTFRRISDMYGKDRVIWRFDPLILTPEINVETLLSKIEKLGNELVKYTNKLVFSFIDISDYAKVQRNLINEIPILNKHNLEFSEFNKEQKEILALSLMKLTENWRQINPEFNIATCAEDIDLNQYGINHNKCIDDDLMIKSFSHDKILMDYLGYSETNTLFGAQRPKLKDKGQRKACGCIISKDIGSYNTCNHLCVYCYANTSRKTVENNLNKISLESDSLI